jgi:uroporphyrinogen-III decarboxylase
MLSTKESTMPAAMTNRERYLATLKFEETDRPIRQEALGIDEETTARWLAAGWKPSRPAFDFYGEFGFDSVAPAFFGAHLHPGFWPLFEEKMVRDEGRVQVWQTSAGIIQERMVGSMSIPRFLRFPVETIGDFDQLRERLDPDAPGRVEPWKFAFDLAAGAQWPLYTFFAGCFGTHRHLMGFENLMAAYVLDPELIHAMSAAWEKLTIGTLRRLRALGPLDAVCLWEDMCYRNGPMISPKMFNEYIQPYYLRVCAAAFELGVSGIHVDTDGDCRLLIPLFVEAGVNYLEPFEVQSGMDIRQVRADFPRLVIHGGLDKRTLARDRAAIDAELDAKLPLLLARRGYIPSIDHVIPPDVPLENWTYFLERVRNWNKG